MLLVFSLIGRWTLRGWLRRRRREGLCVSPTVAVGRVDSVAELIREMRANQGSGMKVVAACVSGIDSPTYAGSTVEGVPIYGTPEQALLAVAEYQAEIVAVSSHPDLVGHSLRRLGWALEELGVDLVVSPGIVEVAGPRLTLRPASGMSLLHVERPMHSGVRAVGKALLDRALAASITFAFLPLMVAVAVAIKLDSKGPVFFRQTRIGALGEPFGMVKFRSMVTDAEAQLAKVAAQSDGNGVLFKMKDDPRVTAVGRFIRRYSIDELPQLINVIRGEMSLIGPRPPLPAEVAQYESDAIRRLRVRPGMTGLWQVSGRSDLSWEDSLRLDLWYVDNWTPILDLQILVRTFKAVVGSSGAY
jgi:exopolysaccharide biosynthesis polyprenyl glycosylphosphotransferase